MSTNTYNNPNSVIAEIFDNEPKFREGFATEELRPGMGVTVDVSGTENTVSAAGQDSRTTYVVRDPPHNQDAPEVGGMDTSNLDATVATDGHVYVVGFLRFQQARLRVADTSGAAEGDEVGWDSNGEISDVQTDGSTALTSFVGQVRELISDDSLESDIARVEFY